MIIYIKAVGSGKHVKVFDRILGRDAYMGFLELADGEVEVDIATYNGEEGDIDILKGAVSPPNVYSKTNYPAKESEIINISDGQD